MHMWVRGLQASVHLFVWGDSSVVPAEMIFGSLFSSLAMPASHRCEMRAISADQCSHMHCLFLVGLQSHMCMCVRLYEFQ